MRQIAIWLGVSVAPAGAEVDEVVSTTASGTTTSRAGAQPVLNPFDDGSAIQVVAGTRSGEADFGLPLLLQLEDACVAARGVLPLEDRARVDGLIGIRARSQATAGGTSLVGELARFVHGAAADGRSRTTASRDRYARARITKAYLWPDLPGSSLTSDVIQSDFTNLFQIVLSASCPSAKRKRITGGMACPAPHPNSLTGSAVHSCLNVPSGAAPFVASPCQDAKSSSTPSASDAPATQVHIECGV
jgi:hypothetical protein